MAKHSIFSAPGLSTVAALAILAGGLAPLPPLASAWAGAPPIDADGDGVPSVLDCDDGDPRIGKPPLAYNDRDGDGYGGDVTRRSCEGLNKEWIGRSGDCDDMSPSVNPGAVESWNGIDDDCDGEVDNCEGGVSLDATDAPTWYEDIDGDGFGDPETAIIACSAPADQIATGGDCDDSDDEVYPGADGEVLGDGVDTDCDGEDAAPFVDEDFEDGVSGAAVDGTGCWSCVRGYSCDETGSDSVAHGGDGSLYTSDSSSALLYCSAEDFSRDFAFEAWFWDDGTSEIEFRVFFHGEISGDSTPSVFVGFNTILCDDDRYCAQQLDEDLVTSAAQDLGARAEGWHRISATAHYTSAEAIDWDLCIGDDIAEDHCADLSSSGYAVRAFRLHHDGFGTWADDFLAWSI